MFELPGLLYRQKYTVIYRASKIEYWAPSSANAKAARIVVDFGENIQIVSKHEMGAQFFHRTEVIV